MKFKISFTMMILAILAGSLSAQKIPQVIFYQGYLTDNNGDPINQNHAMTFRIYTALTGGEKRWEEVNSSIPVNRGVFSILLGSQNPIPMDIFSDKMRFLEIVIGNETLSPRQQIASVPYAYTAGSVQGSANVFPTQGNVGIGTTNPQSALDVRGKQFSIGTAMYSDGNSPSGKSIVGTDGVNTDLAAATDDKGSVRILDGNGDGALAISNWENSRLDSYKNKKTKESSDLILQNDGGNVGIGLDNPTAKLQVKGSIHSTEGGFKFPDGSTQTTASTGGGAAGDNLGNHIATKNISTNGHFISHDGTDQGIRIFPPGPGEGYPPIIRISGLELDVKCPAAFRDGMSVECSSIPFRVKDKAGNEATFPYSADCALHAKHNNGPYGMIGTSTRGVYGYNNKTTQYAGYFEGNLKCTGTLYKAGGSFQIDHPLDPSNKYLNHSFVESPDMMNIYNGNVMLDANGEATVTMPDWFEPLNRDFRYQLTCIGSYAHIYIVEKMKNNSFKISGGKSGMEVSWQVTGIRKDPWANAHRIEVEQNKVGDKQGKYLHPTENGVSETLGIGYTERLKFENEISKRKNDVD